MSRTQGDPTRTVNERMPKAPGVPVLVSDLFLHLSICQGLQEWAPLVSISCVPNCNLHCGQRVLTEGRDRHVCWEGDALDAQLLPLLPPPGRAHTQPQRPHTGAQVHLATLSAGQTGLPSSTISQVWNAQPLSEFSPNTTSKDYILTSPPTPPAP